MNKVVKTILFIIIAGSLVFLIARPKLNFGSNDKEPAVPVNNDARNRILTVDGKIVGTKDIENKISVTGSIMANEEVNITSEISGKIERIHFREGQKVQKGQLLVSINDDELRAHLEKEKYNLKLFLETEFRQKQLLEREAISQEEYDRALTELNTSEAQIKLLEAQLAKTNIRAPFNGNLGLRQVSEGSYITPNETITRLYSLNPVKVEFSIPGKYGNDIQAGKRINFTVDGINKSFTGEVYAIEPEIDPRTRTLMMRAISHNKDELLLPGQFAKIELILESLKDVIMIPTESVVPELGGHKVFVANNGIVNSIPVEIGLRTDREIQIIEGLNKGDTILTSGILQVNPGQNINVELLTE